jgi:hypothetical protein
MNKASEWFLNLTTYGFTVAGIATNFETIKSLILFVLGFVFLILQIIVKQQEYKINKKKENDANSDQRA